MLNTQQLATKLKDLQKNLVQLQKQYTQEQESIFEVQKQIDDRETSLRNLIANEDKTIQEKVATKTNECLSGLAQQSYEAQELFIQSRDMLNERRMMLGELSYQKLFQMGVLEELQSSLQETEASNQNYNSNIDQQKLFNSQMRQDIDKSEMKIQDLKKQKDDLRRQIINLNDVRQVLNRFGPNQDLAKLDWTKFELPKEDVKQNYNEYNPNDDFWYKENNKDIYFPPIKQELKPSQKLQRNK